MMEYTHRRTNLIKQQFDKLRICPLGPKFGIIAAFQGKDESTDWGHVTAYGKDLKRKTR